MSNKKGTVESVGDNRVTANPENYEVTKIAGTPTGDGKGAVKSINDGRVTHPENYIVTKIDDSKKTDKN